MYPMKETWVYTNAIKSNVTHVVEDPSPPAKSKTGTSNTALNKSKGLEVYSTIPTRRVQNHSNTDQEIFLPLAASLAFAAAIRSLLTSLPSFALIDVLVVLGTVKESTASLSSPEVRKAARDGLTFSFEFARPVAAGRGGRGLSVAGYERASGSNGLEGSTGELPAVIFSDEDFALASGSRSSESILLGTWASVPGGASIGLSRKKAGVLAFGRSVPGERWAASCCDGLLGLRELMLKDLSGVRSVPLVTVLLFLVLPVGRSAFPGAAVPGEPTL
jgi:hypothetical protein